MNSIMVAKELLAAAKLLNAKETTVADILTKAELVAAERKFNIWMRKQLLTGTWDDYDIFFDDVNDWAFMNIPNRIKGDEVAEASHLLTEYLVDKYKPQAVVTAGTKTASGQQFSNAVSREMLHVRAVKPALSRDSEFQRAWLRLLESAESLDSLV